MILTTFMLTFALVAGSPIPDYPDRGEPMQTWAYTEDLRDERHVNGYLPEDMLRPVRSDHGPCMLEQEAAQSWRRLLKLARQHGISVKAGWCYRPYDAQVATYERNCPMTDVEIERKIQVVTKKGKKRWRTEVTIVTERICDPPTAEPGSSNHGWGRAVDVQSKGELLTCATEAFRWMKKHAKDYGWVHPSWAHCGSALEEPWHWEWGGTVEKQFRVHTLGMD